MTCHLSRTMPTWSSAELAASSCRAFMASSAAICLATFLLGALTVGKVCAPTATQYWNLRGNVGQSITMAGLWDPPHLCQAATLHYLYLLTHITSMWLFRPWTASAPTHLLPLVSPDLAKHSTCWGHLSLTPSRKRSFEEYVHRTPKEGAAKACPGPHPLCPNSHCHAVHTVTLPNPRSL